jgi:hypothetical protein
MTASGRAATNASIVRIIQACRCASRTTTTSDRPRARASTSVDRIPAWSTSTTSPPWSAGSHGASPHGTGPAAIVGARTGSRGPNAALYAVVGAVGHAAGVDVGPDGITVAVANITGEERGRATVTGRSDDLHAG